MTAPALSLLPADRAALAMLWDAEQTAGPAGGYARSTVTETRVYASPDGAWRLVGVHHRTVAQLLALGLLDVESYERRWDSVVLTDAGRAAATADHDCPVVAP